MAISMVEKETVRHTLGLVASTQRTDSIFVVFMHGLPGAVFWWRFGPITRPFSRQRPRQTPKPLLPKRFKITWEQKPHLPPSACPSSCQLVSMGRGGFFQGKIRRKNDLSLHWVFDLPLVPCDGP